MTRPYDIRYLRTAERDLIDIFEYIKKDNPAAAFSQLERFDTSISQLALTPFLGTIPKDERLKRLGYRILIVDKYLVFYIVKNKTVQIRRIIHGARRYSFLL
jgi:toxin ParE1/3/4